MFSWKGIKLEIGFPYFSVSVINDHMGLNVWGAFSNPLIIVYFSVVPVLLQKASGRFNQCTDTSLEVKPSGWDSPGNSWWGCAAQFSKSWPYFRLKNSHLFSTPVFRPGAHFSNVPITFQVRKAVFRVCFQDQSFNNFENDVIKLTVNEAEMTGMWARNCVTIQQVDKLTFSSPSWT